MSTNRRQLRNKGAAIAKIALAATIAASFGATAAFAAGPDDPHPQTAPHAQSVSSANDGAAMANEATYRLPGAEIRYTTSAERGASVTGCVLDETFSGTLELPSSLEGHPVTSIAPRAFSGCTALLSLHLPDSVKSIGIQAFKDCSLMSEIRLPAQGCQLGDLLFDGCTALSSLHIPQGIDTYFSRPLSASFLTDITFDAQVTVIPDGLFWGCAKLSSIDLPDSITRIESSAFERCTSLRSISIPRSVRTIEYSTFSGCTALAHVSIPDSVTDIHAQAFANCTSLASVRIPDSVKFIRDEVFSGCTALADVRLPARACQLGERIFAGCDSLTELEIPAGLHASYGKTQGILEAPALASVSFASGATSIADRLFMSCPSLQEIDIPTTVATIGDDAFRNCPSLERVFVPQSVTSIGQTAFAKSDKILLEVWQGSAALAYALDQGIATIVFVAEPAPAHQLVYTGEEIVGVPSGEGYAFEGIAKATNAGTYTVTASLNPGYCWPDRSTEPKAISWSIERAPIALPDAVAHPIYNGAMQKGVAPGQGYLLSGTTEAKHAGSYRACATPDENHCWQNGSVEAAPIEWSIARAPLLATYISETIEGNAKPSLSVRVEGFVGGEDRTTASGYRDPLVKAPETLEPGRSYNLVPEGGVADDYVFSYEAGTLLLLETPAPEFDDVAADQWYAEWVQRAVSAGLMKGRDSAGGAPSGLFDPEGHLKRSEAILILYRAATGASPHEPNGENSTPLVDLPEGELFYANALNWAWREGFVTGDMDDAGNLLYTFRPDDTISRQELAVMIHRVAGGKAASDGGNAYRECVDAGSEEAYATQALAWCASEGILTGAEVEGFLYLNASEPATRAQAAKIFVMSQSHVKEAV